MSGNAKRFCFGPDFESQALFQAWRITNGDVYVLSENTSLRIWWIPGEKGTRFNDLCCSSFSISLSPQIWLVSLSSKSKRGLNPSWINTNMIPNKDHAHSVSFKSTFYIASIKTGVKWRSSRSRTESARLIYLDPENDRFHSRSRILKECLDKCFTWVIPVPMG